MPFCGRCGAQIAEGNIDRQRELASCGNCGTLIDLRALGVPPQPVPAQAPGAPTAAEPAAGASAPAPMAPRQLGAVAKGMTVLQEAGRLTIVRRWWRTKHLVMAGLLGVAIIWLAMQWSEALSDGGSPETWLIVVTVFVAIWDLMVIRMFASKTTITVSSGQVAVRTTPIPFLISPNVTVSAGELAQLFAVKEGSFYSVNAELRSGNVVRLARLIKLADQALAIEEQIEAALGIQDRAVDGELPREGRRAYAHVSGAHPLASAPGAAGEVPAAKKPLISASPLALILIIPIGMLAMMMHAFTSGVEGSLSGTGPAGSWAFQPDSCSSGQPLGFMGVELMSDQDRSRRVRLMKDELDRPKVAILEQGKTPMVIDAAACPDAKLSIVRTNDQTNNVYLMKGSIASNCPALKGNVTFERCGL